MSTGGIVLCGGESTRMGRPKAWLRFGDEFLLSHIVRVVEEAVGPVVVVAAAGQELPPLPEEVLVVRDARPGRGPLEGLAAGLRAMADRADVVFLGACDMPGISVPFVQTVVKAVVEPYRMAVPRIEGQIHPLAAGYSVSILPVVDEMLNLDRLAVKELFERFPVRNLSEDEICAVVPGMNAFLNLNTPEDFERLRSAGY